MCSRSDLLDLGWYTPSREARSNISNLVVQVMFVKFEEEGMSYIA